MSSRQMYTSPLQSITLSSSLSSVSVASHYSHIVLISCSFFHISFTIFHDSYLATRISIVICLCTSALRISTSPTRSQQLSTQCFLPFHHLTAACNHHHHLINAMQCNTCSGFGFVSFYTLEECEKALQAMNGGECDGRLIRVEKAKRNSGYSKTPGVCKCCRIDVVVHLPYCCYRMELN